MNQLKFGYSFSWSGFNEIVAKALKAENNGFDFLWYHDHLLIPSSSTVLESFSVLGGLAVSTKSCDDVDKLFILVLYYCRDHYNPT